MKIFLLCVCVAVATAALPQSFINRYHGDVSKTNEELLKMASNRREFKNSSIPMRSTPLSNPLKRRPISSRHSDIHTECFETRLDHFSDTDLRTVDFHYYLKQDYFTSNGPIFIYINDGDIFTTEFLDTGLMHDIAIDVNAALVTADLRYFRSNLPTEDASFENLRFLSAEQSIADIGVLIEAVREELNSPDSNVILWGTARGASLATWAKREFPESIQVLDSLWGLNNEFKKHEIDKNMFFPGVWSSSGIFESTLITHEPYESLSNTIREVGGVECAENVRNAFIEFEYLTRIYDWFFVEDSLGLCIFIWDFYDEEMAIASHGLIEMIINFFEVYHHHGILNFCADMQSNGREEAFDAFARWIRHVFTDRTCLQFDYNNRIYLAAEDNWSEIEQLAWSPIDHMYPFESRPLLHQRCNQFANLPVTVNSDTLFGRLIQQEFWFLYCSDSFYDGEYDFTQLAASAQALNQNFGGKDPDVDDIIFTNGELDPYFSFGITEYEGEDSHVFNIPLHFKSADIFSETVFDAPQLREVKGQIREIITRWATS